MIRISPDTGLKIHCDKRERMTF